MTNLYVKPLHPDSKIPKQQTDHAACYDVCAHIIPYDGDSDLQIKAYNAKNEYFEIFQTYDANRLLIMPGDRILVPTGIAVCCDEGFKVQLVPRSGLSFKRGLMLSNSVGTIDADYRNELFVIFTNNSEEVIKLEHHERIAQIELIRLTPTTIMVGDLPNTASNRKGGIGHTGT